MVGAAIGMAVAAAGAVTQGAKEKQSLDYNAQVQENNAQSAVLSAKLNADKQSMLSNRQIGAETAGYAASGVTSDSGSVMSVLSASAANAEIDRQNVLYGGQIRATNYKNQQSLDKTSGSNALAGSYFKAAGSIGMGAAKMYSGAGAGSVGSSSGVGGGGNNYDDALGDFDFGDQ